MLNPPITITQTQLQKIQLASMGLLTPPEKPATKETVHHFIKKMGYLQIDTMQAVARAPYLILWNHLGNYDSTWLDELLSEGQLFEFYAHALCFIPIEEFPYYRGLTIAGERPRRIWRPEILDLFPKIEQSVLDTIHKEGAKCSSDFPSREMPEGYRNSWGGNKPEKLIMQVLWSQMKLMTAYRKKFRRYYDLTERVMPNWNDDQAASSKNTYTHFIEQAVKTLGAAKPKWAQTFYYINQIKYPAKRFEQEADQGKWIPLKVDDWEETLYMHPENSSLLEKALNNQLEATLTTFLCPFDPLLTFRDRLEEVFNFKYRLESYTPKAKRVYGYFCLPVLHNGKIIGRIDAKAWRKEKRMEIKTFHLEPGIELNEDDIMQIQESLWDFTHWHGLNEWAITKSDPLTLKDRFHPV